MFGRKHHLLGGLLIGTTVGTVAGIVAGFVAGVTARFAYDKYVKENKYVKEKKVHKNFIYFKRRYLNAHFLLR
jgi:hypothetical protein